tara:strand:+ start:192 stop:848 length:657 start_codon:yes stop_codon:yes gene_type:complete
MVNSITTHTGIVAPIDRVNVDTDMIIPKQFLKSIKRTGFGQNLFDELRYLDVGYPGQNCSSRPLNMKFPLNQERYEHASILLTRKNFGCGSSREHAPWALEDYGFKVLIAPSFADIFYNNCFKNGILPITLIDSEVEFLFEKLYSTENFSLCIDLVNQSVRNNSGEEFEFKFIIDSFYKDCLLQGFDEIDLTLKDREFIQKFEKQREKSCPWVFGAIR